MGSAKLRLKGDPVRIAIPINTPRNLKVRILSLAIWSIGGGGLVVCKYCHDQKVMVVGSKPASAILL